MTKKKLLKRYKNGGKIPKYEEGAITPTPPTSPYQLPYGMIGNVGAGIIDASVPVNEQGKNVIGKDIASDALRMSGTGASIGTMIAPGVGTAIGAGAGAILGAGMGYFRGKSEKNTYQQDAQNDNFQRQQQTWMQKPQFFAEGGNIYLSKSSGPINVGPYSGQFGVNPSTTTVENNTGDREMRGPNTIEVEGGGPNMNMGELEVSKGKIIKDFKGKPMHTNGGYQYEAKPGRVIIPLKDREKYMTSDTFTRISMEKRLILDQKKREQKEFKDGGPVNRELETGNMITQYAEGGQPKLVRLNKMSGSKLRNSIPTYTKGGIYDYLKPNPQNQDPNNDPEFIIPRKGLQPTEDMIDNPYQQPEQPEDYSYLFHQPTQIQNTNKPDWSNIANTAATYAAPVFNSLMAFGKANKEAPIYNPYTDEALNTMRNRKINLDPIKRDIFSQARVASQPLGENQGSYLTRRTQIGANTQKALTDANIKAQEINNNYSADYANSLNSLGQQRREADFAARHQTLANKYNKAAYLPKAITQLGQIGRENLNIPMYADLEKNKYAMSLLSQGYSRDQAKVETDKAYGVQNSNRYQWLQQP